jgi:hypothetical protein
MRSLLAAAQASFRRRAADAQVEVIVVGITARGLMKDPGGSDHRARRVFVAGRVPQKTSLELVGAEKPLHAGLVVQDERAHEVPVARFVETKHAVAKHRKAETIEP